MPEFDEFALALAKAQIPNDDGTLKLAYITFDGDDSLKPPDSPEKNYRIKKQYALPASFLHADLEPVGLLRWVNVSKDRLLNGRSVPAIGDNIVVKYKRGVALTILPSSATKYTDADGSVYTFVIVQKVEGQKQLQPVWVAQELLSETEVPK